MAENEVSQVTYEELESIENDFEEIENQIMIKQYELIQAAYARRASAISKIPNFWPLVIEACPPEIDSFVHPQDSQIFADSLLSIDITRPEITTGHPRTFHVKFEFKENEYFSDTTLEKTFYYRRAKDNWVNLVSEPTKIHWKEGQDLTEGLTDGAVALFSARKKAGDMNKKDLPEYTTLQKKLETTNGQNTSFFSWFGFVSSRRWVSAEESKAAFAEHASLQAARKRGEQVQIPLEGENEGDDDEDEGYGDQAVEVFENGDDLAIALSDDIWPGAIRYFTAAQEMGDENDMDLEDFDEDDEEDDETPVNIRELVGSGGKKNKRHSDVGAPNNKKVKK